MSEHRDTARLSRSLAALTIGAVRQREALAQDAGPLAMGDMAQFVQVPVTGRVGHTIIAQEVIVGWEHPFLSRLRPLRSNIPFTNPHVASGVELQTPDFVTIDAQILEWGVTEREFITGARVRITAVSPGAPKQVAFRGVVHMTFSGYAAPMVDDSQG